MDSRVNAFYESLQGKRVAVCGIGISNTPLIEKLIGCGARITACDRRGREQLGELAGKLEENGVELHLGDDYLKNIKADILFRTPGMSYFTPELTEYRRRGMVITSEMEVFFSVCPCRIIAVTGSDGKTTTTTLIAEMLKRAGKTVWLGGNIGAPLLPQAGQMQPDDYAVVELSSFQLMSMRQSPDIAVVTNLAPNHLDIHKDMQEYMDAKKNILLHQTGFGRAILNLDNDVTRLFAGLTRGDTLFFSRRQPVSTGAYVGGDGMICFARNGEAQPVMHREDIKLPGEHNVENYLAAIAAVWGIVPPGVMKETAETFAGVEHRIELVRERKGVRWYNDSIASSPTRTIAGLNAFRQKVILIAGGYDKHIPFDVLGPKVVEKVKTLILCGATSDKIEAAVKKSPGYEAGHPDILRVGNMQEAVRAADSTAADGDIVTLSPACASFDQYPNFAARGIHFKELVGALSDE